MYLALKVVVFCADKNIYLGIKLLTNGPKNVKIQPN